MAPAEIVLAEILIRIEGWIPEDGPRDQVSDALFALNDAASDTWFYDGVELTEAGAALVARYREHMAATRDAKAIGTINGVP